MRAGSMGFGSIEGVLLEELLAGDGGDGAAGVGLGELGLVVFDPDDGGGLGVEVVEGGVLVFAGEEVGDGGGPLTSR